MSGTSSPWGLAAALTREPRFAGLIEDQAGGRGTRSGRDMLRRVQGVAHGDGQWWRDAPAATSFARALGAAASIGSLRDLLSGGARTQLGFGATAAVTVAGGGGTATLTISCQQFGVTSDLVIDSDGSPGDIEVTSITHNNDPLIVGQIPPEVWDPRSVVRPPLLRSIRPGDTLTIGLLNNNVALRRVTAFIAAVPLPEGMTQQLMTVLNAGPSSILAWGPAAGFATIGAGGSGTFAIIASEPGIADRLVLLGGGSGSTRVTAFTINNNPFFSGAIAGGALNFLSWLAQRAFIGVDPSSQISVTVANDGAAAADIVAVLTAAPPLTMLAA